MKYFGFIFSESIHRFIDLHCSFYFFPRVTGFMKVCDELCISEISIEELKCKII